MAKEAVVGFKLAEARQLKALIGVQQEDTVGGMSLMGDRSTALSVAYTTSGATARSGTTLGTGTATLYYLAQSGTTRTLTTQTIDVTFYNMSATAVAATKYVMLLRLGDTWLCNWEDC